MCVHVHARGGVFLSSALAKYNFEFFYYRHMHYFVKQVKQLWHYKEKRKTLGNGFRTHQNSLQWGSLLDIGMPSWWSDFKGRERQTEREKILLSLLISPCHSSLLSTQAVNLKCRKRGHIRHGNAEPKCEGFFLTVSFYFHFRVLTHFIDISHVVWPPFLLLNATSNVVLVL